MTEEAKEKATQIVLDDEAATKAITGALNLLGLPWHEKNVRPLLNVYETGHAAALASQWVRIEDGLPETGEWVLLEYTLSGGWHLLYDVARLEADDFKGGRHWIIRRTLDFPKAAKILKWKSAGLNQEKADV